MRQICASAYMTADYIHQIASNALYGALFLCIRLYDIAF
nr:MAG TPA: hypothetical protein [Caudoviricetes sp.]DAU88633.1 MAG TPA: hypothetical protein [Caudoviricetes sp.]